MRTIMLFLAAGTLAAGIATSSAPVVTHVAPDAPVVGDQAQLVAVHGKEFMPDLTLYVTSPDGAATHYSGAAIQARTEMTFQAALVFPTPGRYQLVVTNTDGGTSPPFTVEARATPAKVEGPVISSITPAEPAKLPEAQALRVDGQRFEAGLRAIVTDPVGTEIPEVEVSKITAGSFELRVRLAQAGTYEVVVSNPSGAVSNVFQLTVR